MKITFDTSAFWDTGLSYGEIYHTVAEAGYHYISPYNADFPGFWKRPKATDEEVMWHKKAIDAEGLEIASLTTGFRIEHTDDFYETSNDAYDIIRYYDSPALGYLYSIPHTFHYDGGKGDVSSMLKYAKRHLKHIIVADTWNYKKLFRYNVNPAGLYADGTVRCHAHIGKIGDGDVDFDACFETLRELGFGDQEDTIATFNPLGFPERAVVDGRHTMEMLKQGLLSKQ